ncbi:uncharacterized protein LOC125676111 isoform X4 [Ostrea edulis]|uniref:uncharacterized protein LOC125676111 isoform X4 n=1 Tax=Ostrea edulis TaxID=37623 RepID=UPI0024AFED89|nr:uncharacterized protein LOC125676111 isoform X4 [Ostrea edulis]
MYKCVKNTKVKHKKRRINHHTVPCYIEAMIDSVGGPQRMNNLLTTLDLPFINNKSLKTMERRAGQFIEKYAEENMKKESAMAYEKEMITISQKEEDVKEEFSNLGVAVISDEFHGDVSRLADQSTCTSFDSPGDGNSSKGSKLEQATYEVILDPNKDVASYDAHRSKKPHPAVKKLSFPPKSRKGMTVCIDHGWQKRGFDSLTGHTFMMSKENKVLKAVVTHRTCGVCKWWKRNRPGVKVREHRCVWNHRGSARAMESEAGLKAIKDMIQEGFQ